MRAALVVAAYAALAQAQDLDWAAIQSADAVPTASIPVVYVTAEGASSTASATTASYDATSAAASISVAVATQAATLSSAATEETQVATVQEKRGLTKTICVAQPTGVNIHPSPDTASAFAVYPYFSSVALAAPVPTGYTQTFSNLDASSQAYGYMGYTLMDSFDTQTCSEKCTAIDGCTAINVYFERNPSVDPNDDSCADPTSTTQIKCVFWGGPVDKKTATNNGQWRNKFHVVIAGSNGYISNTITPAPGFDTPQALGSATIRAPLDCSDSDTYMGMRLFTDGPFDASKCAAVCTATSDFDRTHGFWQTCQYFTTFMLYKNNKPVGQYCSMYTKSWETSYADNTGYWNGNDHYTIGYSYAYTNATDAGSSRYSCVDTSCNNNGAEWAYYNRTAEDAGLDPVTYKSVAPVFQSTTTHIGGLSLSANQVSTLYGTSARLSASDAVLNHRGYFFARETGTYTFGIPACDDVAYVWVGETAYSGFNEGNALVRSTTQDTGAVSTTKYLTAGTYYPLRVIYGNLDAGVGSLYFTITSPTGVVLHNADGSASKFLVQKSCDGKAPAFPAFGREI